MLTPDTMLHSAAELADAQARDDTESRAAIAWQLYGAAGEDVAEIGRLFSGLDTPAPAQLVNWLRAISDLQHWSKWPQRHPGQARRIPYQHRLTTDLGS